MKYATLSVFLSAGLASLTLTPASFAHSQIAGDWQGTLSANGAELRLALHISMPPRTELLPPRSTAWTRAPTASQSAPSRLRGTAAQLSASRRTCGTYNGT